MEFQLFMRRFVTAALFDGSSPNAVDALNTSDHRTDGYLRVIASLRKAAPWRQGDTIS
jgi:hypothetical protein